MTTLSEKALIQRINRKLIKDDEALRKTRPGRWQFDLGDYYIVDIRYNFILHKDVDLAQLAKKLGVA